MEKTQILFPGPMLKKLRTLSAEEGQPVSELVRRAVERYLSQVSMLAIPREKRRKFPTFDGGEILVSADKLRDLV